MELKMERYHLPCWQPMAAGFTGAGYFFRHAFSLLLSVTSFETITTY